MALKEKILDRAQKFIQKGALDKAVIEYKAALDLDPRDISIRLRVGDLYVKLGKKPEAIKEYTEVARANSQRGFYLKAIAVYKQVLKLEESLDIHYKLAELYAKQRLIADSVSEYSQIVSNFEKKGKTSEVMELLKKMIEIDPENIGIRLKLAELYQKLSFEKDALEEYCRIFEKLVAQGKLEKAEKIFVNLYNQNPREPRVLKGLASLSRQKGDSNQYLRFSKALFYVHKDDGAADSARAVCEEILSVKPDEHEAQKFLKQFSKAEVSAREKAEEEERRKAEAERKAVEEAERIAREAVERAALEEAESKARAEAEQKAEEAPLIEFPAAEEAAPEAVEHEIEISLEGFDELETSPVEQITEEAEKASPGLKTEGDGDEYVEVNIPGLENLEPAFKSAAEEPTITIPENLPESQEEEAEGIEEAIEEIEEGASQEEQAKIQEEPSHEEALIEIPVELKEPQPTEQAAAETQEPLIDIELPEEAAVEQHPEPQAEQGTLEEPLIEIEMPEAAGPAPEISEAAAVETDEIKAAPAEPVIEAAPEVLSSVVQEEEKEPEFEVRERPRAAGQETEKTPSAPIEMAERMEAHEASVDVGDTVHEKVSFELKETYPVAPPQLEEIKKDERIIDVSEIPELAEAVAKSEENAGAEIETAVPAQEAEEDLSDAISELMEKMGGEQPVEEALEARAEKALIEEELPGPEEMIEPEKGRGEEQKTGQREEYVDLSAELGMEEALEDLAGKWEGKESKEAFDEFKSGIGQQLSKEDSETHYNLGIAYMEMELHSEAAKEFKIALKDPRLEFDCYIRLGLCSMALSDPQEAIVYYLKGLKTEGASVEERKGMMYELALAYEAAGDMEEAKQIFNSIHSTDPDYREVASKIKEFAFERPHIPLDDGMIEVELL